MGFLSSLLSFTILFSLNTAFGDSCRFVTKTYQNRLQKKFQQNPIRLVETYTTASHKLFLKDIDHPSVAKVQNHILKSSFDLTTLNRALLKNLKTRSITRYFMDWIRTQYWGNIDQLYHNKEITLKTIAYDSLSPQEFEVTQAYPVFTKATQLKNRKCSFQEQSFNMCPGVIFEASVQFSPYLSCRQEILRKPFTGKFILSYKKNQGFKILDVELSGKRIVLDTLKFLSDQRRKGLSSSALVDQLKLLSSNSGSFMMPSVIQHSNNFLARFNTNSPRVPASL